MADVSRETVPAPDPAVAAQVFAPGRLALLERYAGLLATEGVTRGLIGPREVPRLWDRHLLNCGLLAPLIPDGATVADLGSGAGLPGVVLAIARPDLTVTLVEPMARRVGFLDEVRAALQLPNVEVVRARAERWPESGRFDVVTARALAALPKLLAWCLPLVAEHGELLAMKGSSAQDEIVAAAPELRRWRARAEVVTSSVPGSSVTTVVRVVRQPGTAIG
ncbi:16S rRNA (guanine(527)-N(7))-methyltransferase RsmG [Nocardioides sp.]|jgi:16S rRNA (guanine527-N7)-methyltransferase|uniref:16S rRNA (guanine(527)-N(7))-methyltransferase RsmG n=1 Tax=Nocardioides sp. TaxID=35761 RepID=UPI002F41A3A1